MAAIHPIRILVGAGGTWIDVGVDQGGIWGSDFRSGVEAPAAPVGAGGAGGSRLRWCRTSARRCSCWRCASANPRSGAPQPIHRIIVAAGRMSLLQSRTCPGRVSH